MDCKHCGQSLEADGSFCIHCGEAVEQNRPPAAEQRTEPPQSRKVIRTTLIGLAAGLFLTMICGLGVLLARQQVLGSILNPGNRTPPADAQARSIQAQSAADLPEFTPTNPNLTADPQVNQPDSNTDTDLGNSKEDADNLEPGADPETPSADPQDDQSSPPAGPQVALLTGNALGFSQPPALVAYADDQTGSAPAEVQLAPFCKTGCFRYQGWLGLMSPGDSYEVLYKEPTTAVGVQFWGDPGDGVAHVFVDGEKVWGGSTEGTDANYPGGAFVHYLQISNLPEISNRILRIETEPGGGAVTMYFFGAGTALP